MTNSSLDCSMNYSVRWMMMITRFLSFELFTLIPVQHHHSTQMLPFVPTLIPILIDDRSKWYLDYSFVQQFCYFFHERTIQKNLVTAIEVKISNFFQKNFKKFILDVVGGHQHCIAADLVQCWRGVSIHFDCMQTYDSSCFAVAWFVLIVQKLLT